MCAEVDKPVAGKESPGPPHAFLRWAFAVGWLKAILDRVLEQLVSVSLMQAVSVQAPYQHQH